jgi:hypothetical protein
VALARDLRHGAAMPGWDWTGWFVAVVDQDGYKVDEVCRLPMFQSITTWSHR